MLIRELVTRLGFDVDFGPLNKFDDKVAETKGALTSMGAAADDAVEQVKGALVTIRNTLIGFSVATAAGAAGLFAIVKSAANVGDEINKTAPLLGFSTEEFQKYRYAAKLAGVENENFAASTQLLLRNVAEANQGNKEIAKSFARIGLTPGQLKGKSTAETLRLMSEGLSKLPTQAERVSVSMDLLGRSGARMGMFLAKGTAEMDSLMSDVEAFGMFSDETAQNAEDFNDSLERVLFFFKGIKNEIAQGLFPVFTGMLNDFREWLSLHRDIIKTGIHHFVEILTNVIQKTWNATKRIVNVFETMIKALGGLENAFELFGIAAFSVLLPLFGPIVLIVKALGYMIIPFLRLHTLIALITFAMGSMLPLWSLFLGVVSALAATRIVGWLINLAGGYRAIAAAMIIPTLEILAQAAAIAILILAFEDLGEWLGGTQKTVIGEWLGSWEEVVPRLKKVWDDIKAIFVAGGKFMAAVFSGDFKEAYRILEEGTAKTATAMEDSMDLVTGGRGAQGLGKGSAGSYVDAWTPNLAPRVSAPSAPYAMAGGNGGPASNLGKSFRLGDMLDTAGNFRTGAGGKTVTQTVHAKVDVNLPKGTPQEHAEETAKIFKDLMDQQVDHSLQQSTPPGE